MKTPHAIRTALAGLATAVLLAGCASTDVAGFPDPDSATVDGGTFINIERLRQYSPGMNKRQLYALLGTPHFNEGLFNVRRWDYVLNVRGANGGTIERCQLRIDFDDDEVARDQAWQPALCAALAAGATLAPAPQQAAQTGDAQAAQPLQLSLQTDALFDFGSATLTPEGHRRLQDVLATLRQVRPTGRIEVTGHADEIGDDTANLVLSQRRADAVREALVAGGVARAAIVANARGESDPKVACAGTGTAHASRVACLAPNLRVDITAPVARDRLAMQPR